MENESLTRLFKSRSYVACIKAGYNLFTDNFKIIFRSTWVFATLIAIIESVVGIFNNPSIITICVGFIIELLLFFVFSGIIFNQLDNHRKTDAYSALNIRNSRKHVLHFSLRTIKMMVWCFIFYIPIMVVVFIAYKFWGIQIMNELYGHVMPWHIIIMTIIGIILFIIYMPMVFVTMKYMMEDGKHFFKTFLHGYVKGFKHLGNVFTTILLAGILTAIAAMVINAPQVIIQTAKSISEQGVTEGDPAGMPAYFPLLTFIVKLITVFVSQYVELVIVYPIYYMYGSIETQEKEKKQFEENLSDNE